MAEMMLMVIKFNNSCTYVLLKNNIIYSYFLAATFDFTQAIKGHILFSQASPRLALGFVFTYILYLQTSMMMVEDRSYICDYFVNIVYAKTEKNCAAFIS